MQQLHKAGRDETQPAAMRDSERHASNSTRLEETARDSKQPLETVRDMQQLHGTGRDSVR